ncbi:MAG: hypothetical protein HKL85_12875 [Acidimicrobiaceae bacterium]|nr:hypothetical protein [Acidimicrobiaceae bacterium]
MADELPGSWAKITGQMIVQFLRVAASTPPTTVLVFTHDERVAGLADHRLEIEDGIITEIAQTPGFLAFRG